jgi:hypothetical protein
MPGKGVSGGALAGQSRPKGANTAASAAKRRTTGGSRPVGGSSITGGGGAGGMLKFTYDGDAPGLKM